MLTEKFLKLNLIFMLIFLIPIPRGYAQGNLQDQFIQQKRIEQENQRKDEQWRADVERQRAKEEAQRNSYAREMANQALKDSVVYTCNEISSICFPQFRAPSGKCWGTIIRFQKEFVYVFSEQLHPSLWPNNEVFKSLYKYDDKSQVISFARSDNHMQSNLVLRDNSLYMKSDPSKQDITKYSCKLTHGSKESIFLYAKKSFRVLKYDDYKLIRKRLMAEGWKSVGNPYLDNSTIEFQEATKLNKLFGGYEFQLCFNKGNNLFSCDTSWTYTGNKENPELFFSVLIDIKSKTTLIEDDAVSN